MPKQSPTATITRVTFPVSGMTCAACQAFVQKTLERQPGVHNASVNLMMHNATVAFDPSGASTSSLVEAIRRSGYDAELPDAGLTAIEEQEQLERKQRLEYKAMRLQAIASLLAGVLVMGLSMLLMHVTPPHQSYPTLWHLRYATSDVLRLSMLGITTVVMGWAGRHFYTGAWSALRHGSSDMNTLVALGTGAAFIYSAGATLVPAVYLRHGLSTNVYYEAVVLIIGMVLLGRTLEARAKAGTTLSLRNLVALQPAHARVLRAEQEVSVPWQEIVPGDTLIVKPGERIAVDGTVLSGVSAVDESMLSGESMPVEKTAGAALAAGTLNQQGAMIYRATRIGSESALGQIVRMLREAQQSRAPIQRIADRVSSIFVPTVIALALATAAAWRWFGGEHAWGFALSAGVAVLVIACPCAMGLAVPTAVMVATGRGAREGFLIKGGEALEKLARIDTIALDKTGTITEGKPRVTDVIPAMGADEGFVYLAAALEQQSEHPLASALVLYAKEAGLRLPVPSSFLAYPGSGATGVVEGHDVSVGKRSWLDQQGIITDSLDQEAERLGHTGRTLLWVSVDRSLVGIIGLADTIRPTSFAAVQSMLKRGWQVSMLTGDQASTAAVLAEQAGVTEFHAGLSPADKVTIVRELRAGKRQVAMVGDGVNDAPALAAADIGIAMASGTDIAAAAADVTMMRSNLTGVVDAIDLGRKTLRIMHQNLFWAFIYNVIGIPIAAGVLYPHYGILLSPIIASCAMAMSSVSVVLNSLRLGRVSEAQR